MNLQFIFKNIVFLTCVFSLPAWVVAAESIHIPMQAGNAHTFYIDGKMGDSIEARFMVDTGSGFTIINQRTLEQLQSKRQAVYVKDLMGILADGSERRVPVYRISSLTLGGACELKNIEAAVFPGTTRQILGLSTLRRTGKFTFSFEPASLLLSHCDSV